MSYLFAKIVMLCLEEERSCTVQTEENMSGYVDIHSAFSEEKRNSAVRLFRNDF